ncbi:carbohydrate esterase family 16 protein [Ceratobasidium sp. AG-Ba]|nr:carbohydrate esterase family 16 protein [Ceratobasidium sp. AG-Ba]QRW11544.1 carbohydrate esterase family 16 protein [Ceratobasidium sp. AG-Ba]
MRVGRILGGSVLFGIASAAIGTGPHWPGLKGVQYIFVFGDSYSTVSWSPSSAPVPTPENPIGVPWPGLTSVGPLQPNWVGYMTNGFNVSNLLAFDYAIAGNNVTGFTNQIQSEFMPTAGQKPATSPWTADNSVFVSWIGINDLHEGADPTTTMNTIMQQQQSLYDVGARNFILINMPPWDRSPMGAQIAGLGPRVLAWNAMLADSTLTFSVAHQDASCLVFSSWDTMTTILNNPARYNITEPTSIGGDVWHDDLHITSFIHQRIANDMAGWLLSLPAGPSPTSSSSTIETTTLVTPSGTAAQTPLLTLTTPEYSASAIYNMPSSKPSSSDG